MPRHRVSSLPNPWMDGRLGQADWSEEPPVRPAPPGYKVSMSRIAVVGTGYVGLTTGACFAHLGHDVICADIVPEKVECLSRGEIPIVEAGLQNLVADGLRSGRLRFVLGAAAA